ncbi:MAG: type II toxin-antitoxin system RelE/ParE family toxin [Candidatus Margulisbacteria bacterium]|nr:type II toxin-antitoxin system RelE/ParE family toxin [Candidatus Margulisiibacteriota bacterium]
MHNSEMNIELYVGSDGKSPFEEWMNGLKDLKIISKVRARLNRIRLGSFGDCKSLHEGVFELRIDFGPGYRVYYGRHGKEIVILLCGGTKKKQSKDIKIAKEFWKDYKRRIKT